MVGDGHRPESDDVLEVCAAELQGVLDESDVAVGFRFLVPEVDAQVGSVDACHAEAAEIGVGGDGMVVGGIVGGRVGRHVYVCGRLHGRVFGVRSIKGVTTRVGGRCAVVLGARTCWEKPRRRVPYVVSLVRRDLRASMTRLFTKVPFTVFLTMIFFHRVHGRIHQSRGSRTSCRRRSSQSLRLGLHKTFGESLSNDGVNGDGRKSKLLGPTLVLYVLVCLTCLVGQLPGSGFREASCSAFVAKVDVFDFGVGEIPILIYLIHR